MRKGVIEKLRNVMKSEGIVAYLVPSEDDHQSEYTPLSFQRRAFVSGFTGSFGLAVVGLSQNWLWTDGRYYNQASLELSSDWQLMKQGLPETPTAENFLSEYFDANAEIGIDAKVMSQSSANSYRAAFKASGKKLKFIERNLVDEVWEDRPKDAPERDIIVLGAESTGASVQEKLASLREEMVKGKADLHVVSALDAIAWLYNFRGADIPYNPVAICYAIVTADAAYLYIDASKVTKDLEAHLSGVVKCLSYESFFDDLAKFSNGKVVWLDPASSAAIFQACDAKEGKSAKVISKASPITLKKALKNESELNGMRACGLRDAAALVEFFSWLEQVSQKEGHGLDECTLSDKVLAFRQQQAQFVTPSFATISSVGSNAAIIHYKPEPVTAATFAREKIYLLDSGGQYRDGTTDVTRTFHFGTPSQKERLAYTCVLKGVIALSEAVFPSGTTGFQIDTLARQALWKQGLDYRHGTGHGVGHFLNVHEGPHGISFRIGSHGTSLQHGMTVTNEPGFYEDGNFGIRIENQMIVRNVETQFKFNNTQYLGFETTTYVPLDFNLIDKSLLNAQELEWVNAYHASCQEKILKLLTTESAKEWLLARTKPL